jgi:hypothetical protein
MNELDLHSFKKEVIADSKVMFALENGLWMEVTSIAKENGKDLQSYWRQQDTVAYMEVVAKSSSVLTTDLKKTIIGKGKNQGTYIHPDMIVHFARFISPKFAFECDRFIKSEFEKTAKIREETLIEYHKEELQKVLRESKKLNDYDGYETVGKYLKEHDDNNYGKDLIYKALTWKGLNRDEKVYTTFRRLPSDTPEYLGKTIAGSRGTPIYPPMVITGVVGEYLDFIENDDEDFIE